jgi:hypothetical protein
MKHTRQILGAFALVALVGAGCDPNRMMQGSSLKLPGNDTEVSATQGFGKLPGIGASGMLGSNAARSSVSVQGMESSLAIAPNAPVPMMANVAVSMDSSVGSGGGTSGKMMMIAPEGEYRQVPVDYAVTATLPSWDSSGDVLKVRNELPDTSAARTLATASGVPSQTFGSGSNVTGVNVQWKSGDMQWTFDAANRYLSFWKEVPYQEPANEKPRYDAAEMKRIADSFLDANGFSSIRETGGEVDDSQIQIMMKESEKMAAGSMPCPMLRSDISVSATPEMAPSAGANAGVTVDPAMPSTMIYPSPCNWWPQQVSVFYNTTREGLPVVEIGGWPNRSNSLTVDIRTKQVTNGVLQLDQRLDRSEYPLVSSETAMKKLMAGGTSPAYSWGTEKQNVKVTIEKVQLVWMRYDSWASGAHDTFYLPALAASGTIVRDTPGHQPEEYKTSVPLVDDSAFQDPLSPTPVAVPLMMEAVSEPAVAPPTPAVMKR